VNWIFIYLY